MDVLAVALVGAEWLAIGSLSRLHWPNATVRPVAWSLWLLIGAFLTGFAQLLLSLLGVGFGDPLFVLLLAVLMAFGLRRTQSGKAQYDTFGKSPQELAGWIFLAAVLAGATLRSWLVPEAGWDAFSHWGLKAAAFATTGTIADAGTVHEYYPPLVPLLEAWLFQHRQAIDINLAKTIWPLIGIAFAVCLTAHLQSVLSYRWLAPYFAALIVLSTTQLLEGFWTGQADLALTVYLTLATLAAWQWFRSHDDAWLIQVALFGAATALTKYEGLPRVGVVVVALVLMCRTTWKPAVTLAVAALLAYAPWLAFRAIYNVPGSSEHIGQLQPQAIGTVLASSFEVLVGIRTGGAVLIAALALVFVGWTQPYRLLTVIVIGEAVATLLAFLVTETAPDVQVRTSLTRLVEQFLPVALFVAATWLANVRPIIRPGR